MGKTSLIPAYFAQLYRQAYQTRPYGNPAFILLPTSVSFDVVGRYVAGDDKTRVSVGEGSNTILVNKDARVISWIPAMGTTFSGFGVQVKYAAGIWVAVGNDRGGPNTILWSQDGIEWFPCTGTTFNFTGLAVDCDPTGTRWVAVGHNAMDTLPDITILTSPNGIDWAPASGPMFYSAGLDVHYSNNRWVAVGTSAGKNSGPGSETILTSTDGINWSNTTGYKFTTTGNSVFYNNGLWVATGFGGASMLMSSDGITWTPVESGAFGISANYVTHMGNLWLSAGERSIRVSRDGKNWLSTDAKFVTASFTVAYGGGVWLAGGAGNKNTVLVSNDGFNWDEMPDPTPSRYTSYITYDTNIEKWIVLGDDNLGKNTLLVSP